MITVSFKTGEIGRIRDRLGRIKDNIRIVGKQTPKKACEIVKRKTQEVLISKTYKEHERHGPLRRGTGKGMAESLRVQNIGVNTYEMRPVGIAETYAVPLEEGHKSPINGGARETGYFKMGRRLAQPALRRLFKDAVKQITR